MRKIINVLSIASSIVSGIIIICTFLTSYQFYYVGEMFSSYLSIQISLAFTLAFWGIKFWIDKEGIHRYMYSLFCFVMSIISILFIMSSVR